MSMVIKHQFLHSCSIKWHRSSGIAICRLHHKKVENTFHKFFYQNAPVSVAQLEGVHCHTTFGPCARSILGLLGQSTGAGLWPNQGFHSWTLDRHSWGPLIEESWEWKKYCEAEFYIKGDKKITSSEPLNSMFDRDGMSEIPEISWPFLKSCFPLKSLPV